MKRIASIIIVGLLLISPQCAQGADSDYTEDHINGRFWKKLDFSGKLYYLYGIIDGVSVISESKPVLDEAHNYSPKVSEMILKSTGRFFIPGGTYKEIVKFIDDYYSDDRNLDVPAYNAYTKYLAEQKDWSALENWDESLKKLRKDVGR